jgi:transposase
LYAPATLPDFWSGSHSFVQKRSSDRTGIRLIDIQEAGLDGFWIHRVLEKKVFESLVVDPASIARSPSTLGCKTDKNLRRERWFVPCWPTNEVNHVSCACQPPSVEEKIGRLTLPGAPGLDHRAHPHTNTIKGLLFPQVSPEYEPFTSRVTAQAARNLDGAMTGSLSGSSQVAD